MKKVIAVIMAVLFIFSFAACSKRGKVDSKQVLLVVSDASEKELQEIVESYDGFSNYSELSSEEKKIQIEIVEGIVTNPNITNSIIAAIDYNVVAMAVNNIQRKEKTLASIGYGDYDTMLEIAKSESATEEQLSAIIDMYEGFSNYKYSSEKEKEKELVNAILANPKITREMLAKIDIDILLAIQSEGSLTANRNILYN